MLVFATLFIFFCSTPLPFISFNQLNSTLCVYFSLAAPHKNIYIFFPSLFFVVSCCRTDETLTSIQKRQNKKLYIKYIFSRLSLSRVLYLFFLYIFFGVCRDYYFEFSGLVLFWCLSVSHRNFHNHSLACRGMKSTNFAKLLNYFNVCTVKRGTLILTTILCCQTLEILNDCETKKAEKGS